MGKRQADRRRACAKSPPATSRSKCWRSPKSRRRQPASELEHAVGFPRPAARARGLIPARPLRGPMDYASSILGFLPGGRRSTGISQLLDKLETYLPPAQIERVREAYEFGAETPPGAEARFRRTLHHAPGRGRRHPRRSASRRRHAGRRHPARRHRGHADGEGRDRRDIRPGGRRTRRRRQQTGSDPVQEPPGSAGRELPQDAARDGARHPRDHGQARRPHAQHAHPRRHAAGQAPPQRARDAGDLRADRRAAGPVRRQARTGGSRAFARSTRTATRCSSAN